MHGLISDLRYAVRLLMKKTGFTAVAVVTLALGIGANAAIFTVVNAVVLQPLPYAQPDRLVRVWDSFPAIGFPKANSNAMEFVRLREGSKAFERVAAYGSGTATLTGTGSPERIVTGHLSSNLLRTLGVKPMLGRGFRDDEEEKSRADIVLLGHRFWQRRFSGDPGVIGRTVTLDGRACTIVGVMPPDFRTPLDLKSAARAELYRPLGLEPAAPLLSGAWQAHWLHVIGRLRPGRTTDEARADSAAVIDAMMREHPEMYPKGIVFNVLAAPMTEDVVGNVKGALLLLLAAVGLVLLIACANVANLLLARAQGRQKELAIRAAVGASRGQIVRQLLVESLLLALAGGAAGLGVAWGVLRGLLAIAPASLPRTEAITIDGPVLWFTLALSLVTGLVFGLVPALHGTRADLQGRLKERTLASLAGGGRVLRSALVVAEVAVAVVVLIGAGLLVRSFWQLQHVDPGLRADGLLTMQLSPSQEAYSTGEAVIGFYRRVQEKAAALPGAEAATLVGPLPIGGGSNDGGMQIEGRVQDWARGNFSADYRVVAANYFQVMGVRLVRGRTFTEADGENGPLVVVVNQTLARRHFPSEDPIGRRVRLLDNAPDKATSPYMTIVGVVDDAKNRGLTTEVHQEMYLPLLQHAKSSPGLQHQMALVVRTAGGDPAPLAGGAMKAVWAVDPTVPVTKVLTMADVIGATVAQPRFNALLLGLFALLALLLGAVGIYGLMSHSVEQRVNEIGIRLALGATPGTVLRRVMREGLLLAAAGLVTGLAAALAGSRLLASLLFGVEVLDPVTFAAAPAVLVLAAALACLVPAVRATRVDPMTALRAE